MNILCESKGRTLIVKVNGEIDHYSSNELKNKTDREYKQTKSKNIVFDFSGVTFMDSSGIGVIMGRYKNVISNGGVIGAVSISKELRKIFDLSGLFKIIKCYENTEIALKDFSVRGQ